MNGEGKMKRMTAIVLLFMLLLSACGKRPEPSPAPVPEPAPVVMPETHDEPDDLSLLMDEVPGLSGFYSAGDLFLLDDAEPEIMDVLGTECRVYTFWCLSGNNSYTARRLAVSTDGDRIFEEQFVRNYWYERTPASGYLDPEKMPQYDGKELFEAAMRDDPSLENYSMMVDEGNVINLQYHLCQVVFFGTDKEEAFTRERTDAVSEDYQWVFEYSVADDVWYQTVL